MNQVQLSDVQIANLTLLLTIRDGILHDRTAACCRFALDAIQAERLGTMSVQQLMAIVANLGESLRLGFVEMRISHDHANRGVTACLESVR